MEAMSLDPESGRHLYLDDGELDKLESDVRQMAKKISEYRQTLPDHLRNTLDSALSSYIGSGSDPLPSSRLTVAETEVNVVLGTEAQDCREKMIELKERMSRNAANIPKVIKRVRECIEGMDKLDSMDGTIHPAFRKRRIN